MANYFDNYLFRCSALGNIISKSGKLTDGVKTYLQECFIGEIYGVKKEAYGKALEKGILCEEDGISMLQNIYSGQLLLKNKEEKKNDFIKGSCDVFKNKIVHDVKNAYTLFTFGKAELSWIYEWQVKGYGMLWKTEKGLLFYCLNDMPEQMLIEEERLLFYKNKWAFVSMEDENYLKACAELRQAHKYGWMNLWERFKTWEVTITDADIEAIKSSVITARKYLNELYDEHQAMIERNKSLLSGSSAIIAKYDKQVKATVIENIPLIKIAK